MWNNGDLRVKLVHDYTKYNEKLEKGTVGFAHETPEQQAERASEDNFVRVTFDGVTTVDVLWKGLEIIDEGYLNAKALERAEYLVQLRTAKNSRQTIGAKGGFKVLEVDFVENGVEVHKVIVDKDEAQEFIETMEKFGIKTETVQLEKKIPTRWKKGKS